MKKKIIKKTKKKAKRTFEQEDKPESAKKFLRELKSKKTLSNKEEFEMMLKSIKINNPWLTDNTLEAFKICDRKFFVSHHPYVDLPLHIAHGQTISQPTTIARMLQLLGLEKGLRILEVGANTGYHACLAAWLVFPGQVVSVEIYTDLVKQAEKNIDKLAEQLKRKKIRGRGYSNVKLVVGDALDSNNDVWNRKYDRIYYTAGVHPNQMAVVKELALRALRENGLLLFPTRESFDFGGLELWQKKNDRLESIKKDSGYSFVPLIRQKDIEEVYEKVKK